MRQLLHDSRGYAYRHGDSALTVLELRPDRSTQRTLRNNGDVRELQWVDGLKMVDLDVYEIISGPLL